MISTPKPLSISRFALILGSLLCGFASADEPAAVQDNDSKQQNSLEVRYARAHLRLAKFDLYRFLEEHQRHPELLPVSGAE
jgi:hypothetical protein